PARDAAHARLNAGDQRRPLSRGPWDGFGLFSAVQLSYLLRVYNSAMSGGLGFAVEVNEPFRLKRAMDAMQYFGLANLAELVADLIEHDLDIYHAGSRHDDLETLLGPQGGALTRAFRVKAAERPADFGLE
ncbi:hypothetical protein ACFWFK_27980, partial [Micromonospora chalcea]